MYSLEYGGHWPLNLVPSGTLFVWCGKIGFKSRYGDCYLLNGGETLVVYGETVVIVLRVIGDGELPADSAGAETEAT